MVGVTKSDGCSVWDGRGGGIDVCKLVRFALLYRPKNALAEVKLVAELVVVVTLVAVGVCADVGVEVWI